MKLLIVGATGFVGRPLVAALGERGDEVVVAGRSGARLQEVFPGLGAVEWDPRAGPVPAGALDGVEGVVSLAGEPVAGGRWTAAKKRRIRDSRVLGTRYLVESIRSAGAKPRVFVSASAIGYYGDTKHQWATEDSPPGRDYLAEVCTAWEAEAARAREAGVRTAIVRMGVVLGREGGAYPLMSRPFRMFVGGNIGLGKRWMSWIHLADTVGILLRCLDDANANGAYNATAPHPVANEELTRTLAGVLRRPALFPVPPLALKVLLGGFAAVVLTSQRVRPLRTLGLGYEFRFPRLRAAVEDLER